MESFLIKKQDYTAIVEELRHVHDHIENTSSKREKLATEKSLLLLLFTEIERYERLYYKCKTDLQQNKYGRFVSMHLFVDQIYYHILPKIHELQEEIESHTKSITELDTELKEYDLQIFNAKKEEQELIMQAQKCLRDMMNIYQKYNLPEHLLDMEMDNWIFHFRAQKRKTFESLLDRPSFYFY
jgi:DNA repair exonuclease SbcCD ATPase subunit